MWKQRRRNGDGSGVGRGKGEKYAACQSLRHRAAASDSGGINGSIDGYSLLKPL
jgi:hypothetical protein